ncbi:MAG: transporter [Verrucomicrobia bacterium]|nr:transporter [Verrucomicrobiota bacterium]
MKSGHIILHATGLSLAFLCPAQGADGAAPDQPKRNVEGIMDNSFLVEEAFNQEAGVVQHIVNGFYSVDRQRGSDNQSVNFSFTQEWPITSQTHQFSYTVPYTTERNAGSWQNGFGDVLLNYRWQAYFSEVRLQGFSPRASLVLPTGDHRRSFGDGTVGAQFNLPFSTAVGDRWFLHSNAGLSWLPHAASTERQDALHYNLGQSVIYAATPTFNLMLEWVGYWNDQPTPAGRTSKEFSSLVSPGVRKAFNFSNGSQLVLGLAAPIGLTRSSPDYGVFLYLSFEHFLTRQK